MERRKTRQELRGAEAREAENEGTSRSTEDWELSSALGNVEVTAHLTRAESEAWWMQRPVGRERTSDSQCGSLCGLKGRRTAQTMGLHKEVGPKWCVC